MLPKVLVGAPVNERKDYCTQEYLDNLKRLTYPNKEFYFVDNSRDYRWHIDAIINREFECEHLKIRSKRNQEYICESQNILRKKTLEENFDFLMFIEQDLFPEPTIIEQLLSYNTQVASAKYFIGQGENTRLLELETEEKVFETITNRNIPHEESYFNYPENSTSTQSGYGCCLIHRSILEQYPFHVSQDDNSHSDTYFALDLYSAGIEITQHPIIVRHHNSSWNQIMDT